LVDMVLLLEYVLHSTYDVLDVFVVGIVILYDLLL